MPFLRYSVNKPKVSWKTGVALLAGTVFAGVATVHTLDSMLGTTAGERTLERGAEEGEDLARTHVQTGVCLGREGCIEDALGNGDGVASESEADTGEPIPTEAAGVLIDFVVRFTDAGYTCVDSEVVDVDLGDNATSLLIDAGTSEAVIESAYGTSIFDDANFLPVGALVAVGECSVTAVSE